MSGPFDIGDVSPRRYFTVLAVVLGLLFAFVAGDDDSGTELLTSLVLWQVQACVPMALLLGAHLAWSRLWLFEALTPWARLAISGLTGALAFSPGAALLDRYLEGDDTPFGLALVLNEAVSIAPPITLAWMAMNAPFVLGLRLTSAGRGAWEAEAATRTPGSGAPDTGEPQAFAPRAADGTESPGETPPPFMQLVPPDARGRILYLQAELHYLAVVTERGRSLILYNLRDAVNEVGAMHGLRAHRSFWVARDAVRGFRRRGRQGVLTVDNGDEIPVSRRRVAAVDALLSGDEPLAA